ncbi:MAG: ecdysteroid 22-kinase family protein [Actinomycetota bacterium]|nr:ecdysteroid 22-kinase family protein [Actinomycetota bacterium]
MTLRDRRELIRKEISPEWDWISRATNDDGRVVSMWERGLFERFPSTIDHATVAAERAGDRWSVFMHDVSAALVSADRRLDRAELRRVLAAVADLHLAFWGERFPELCTLEDRYRLLSPRTARREQERGERVGDIINSCWELFTELVPDDIATAILAIANRPALLAEQLDRCEQTLIHGDVRLNNLGFSDDRVVLVDWGERTGSAPAAVELASFLVFDAKRFDVSRDDVVSDFRSLYGDRFDETALQLALIGGFVQLGCHFTLPIALGGGDEARAAASAELEWWTPKVASALELWSPL